jgi:hypothetical protein
VLAAGADIPKEELLRGLITHQLSTTSIRSLEDEADSYRNLKLPYLDDFDDAAAKRAFQLPPGRLYARTGPGQAWPAPINGGAPVFATATAAATKCMTKITLYDNVATNPLANGNITANFAASEHFKTLTVPMKPQGPPPSRPDKQQMAPRKAAFKVGVVATAQQPPPQTAPRNRTLDIRPQTSFYSVSQSLSDAAGPKLGAVKPIEPHVPIPKKLRLLITPIKASK